MDLPKRRMIFAPVKLNDRTIAALVDSGTSRTIINGGLAKELGLVPLGETSVTSFTRRVAGLCYRAERIELAGMVLKDFVFDSYGTAEIEALSRQRIPLILGRDILGKVDAEVDFVKDRVRWVSMEARRGFQADLILPLHGERAAFPSIDVTLEKMPRERALLDLGSDTPITMAADFAHEHGLLKERRQSSAVSIGLEGVLTNITFSLRNVKIGDFELRDVPVHAVENWKLAQPISLGWPLFQAFRMVLSLGTKTLDMKVDRHILVSEIPRDRLGISGRREEQRLVISHVAPWSPAWHAGLRAGDVVVSVDDRAISRDYPGLGERIGFRAAGSNIRLGLAGGRDIDLMLIDYF
ncbi:pepsin/retropepsin-like aspartic protease family protein [Sphingobium sp. EM0848]|uniref:pepsin/retropepsin-like aspartic protease family protein n=1 Tax=Sphingobium sp. EM0848 TaxID=2743473 RepID=UPI002101C1DF|nr:aspartyl protease family protein [Sphingobium sp. EM0848]